MWSSYRIPTNVGRPRLSYDEGSSLLKRKIAEYREKEKSLAFPVPFTPEEALHLLIENNLIKKQYTNIQQQNKQRNWDIYPRKM